YRVAGEQAPGVSLGDGSPEARKKCRAAWDAWHVKHGKQADLARLQEGERLLGLTLGIEYNTNRVWECGPDGTTRWEITAPQGVSGPMDAWVLPGNRILLADGNGITERDFKGNVLSKIEGLSNASGCQRLPNGHTFVATYNSVMEYDRNGKRLWQHNIPGSNAIRKHRNGNVLYAAGNEITEMDIAGKTVRKVPLPQGFWVGLEDLPGDRFLLADSNNGRVVEVDATGKVRWEGGVAGACGVTRLPNGRTLVATNGQVVELDRSGKVVWDKKVSGYARRVHRR
ncbi:MAG TPA: PQQ-binding-like beta-propeller repeat protein, partial [Gemmataceae bacterium]|nr:PQQ-binding-like beta-propeller repeat protein [Gemmataceae bacterium]